MTNDYPLEASTGNTCLPDEHVVRNIINFARCYQCIEVDGLSMTVFLN